KIAAVAVAVAADTVAVAAVVAADTVAVAAVATAATSCPSAELDSDLTFSAIAGSQSLAAGCTTIQAAALCPVRIHSDKNKLQNERRRCEMQEKCRNASERFWSAAVMLC